MICLLYFQFTTVVVFIIFFNYFRSEDWNLRLMRKKLVKLCFAHPVLNDLLLFASHGEL